MHFEIDENGIGANRLQSTLLSLHYVLGTTLVCFVTHKGQPTLDWFHKMPETLDKFHLATDSLRLLDATLLIFRC